MIVALIKMLIVFEFKLGMPGAGLFTTKVRLMQARLTCMFTVHVCTSSYLKYNKWYLWEPVHSILGKIRSLILLITHKNRKLKYCLLSGVESTLES